MPRKNMTDEQQATINDLREKLIPLSNSLNPPPICWITDGDCAGEDYCPDCIDAAVETLKPEYPNAVADGGHDYFRSNDGCASCASCGKTLSYSLSQEGLRSEMMHFEQGDLPTPLDSETAFAIGAILSELEWCEDTKLIASAIKIGEMAVSTIPSISP